MTQWGLDTLFNPAKRHMDEEKARLQSTRAELGDNSGGKRINFESGRITIKRPDAEVADGDSIDAESTGAESTGADSTVDLTADGERADEPASTEQADTSTAAPVKERTPAQLRAAQRRGRTSK
ncbi:MAG: DUF6191 domain-containing protein [Jatrophihabitans sp.]